MSTTFRSILPHIGTGITVSGLVATAGIWAFNAYAEGIIDQRVGSRLTALESAITELKTHDLIQAQKLNSIHEGQVELKDDSREIQRDIKAILFELKK